ncbi:MAG TPA: RNA polymerase factor sigma-54 [Oscillospiraceae bacterium]|nr:RNA polymerase factor sigma-54 [Oscillospiraceae bacterium]
MHITHNLKLEQTQKLIMTPELQQAISLLQLPVMELQAFLQNEYLNNPVLDLDEEEDKKAEEVQVDSKLENDSIDWDEYLRDQGYEPLPAVQSRANDAAAAVDYALSAEPSLQEHLSSQLGFCSLTTTEKRIGEFLIGNIDSNGYVNGKMEELAALSGLACSELTAILKVIQTFDPVGVGARDLQECLLLQLQELPDAHPLAEAIVSQHLEDVADNKQKKIAAALQVEPAAVQAAIDFIRTLDPKPGRLIGGAADVRYVVPDVSVEKVQDKYVIIVNEQNMPRLTINPYYRSLLGNENQVASDFLKSRFDAALWLVRSLEQRRLTLYRVTECLVKIQQAFLDEGIKYLKPLTLRQIAEEIGVHESTVSRTTANKYLQTPRGLYAFKFFFASGVEDYHGTAISSASVKSHMKELFAAEDQYKPYSDKKLGELLAARGIVVSRRTVAKYREELGVPASSKRKRV